MRNWTRRPLHFGYNGEGEPADSFLYMFVEKGHDDLLRSEKAIETLSISKSEMIEKIAAELSELTNDQLRDFFGRISIVQESARIDQIPALIEQRLRAVDRRHRQVVFERLEGWWVNVVTNHLLAEGVIQSVLEKSLTS